MIQNRPLSVLISQLLVAFTIEHDNEWELRYWVNANPAPFRTSLVMWANFLRFVKRSGISVRELSGKAGFPPGKRHPDLSGMIRWRYVTVESKNSKSPALNDIVRPTALGLQAAEVWTPLVDEIENRWESRFGHTHVNRLKRALIPIIAAHNQQLPHFFPVLNHWDGMRVPIPHQPECSPPEELALPYLLSQVHHLFTLEAERQSDISLAIQSNILRVVDSALIAKRELPLHSGISKEAISMSINFLKKKGLLLEEPAPRGRGKAVKLTELGKAEKTHYAEIVHSVEQLWETKLSAKHLVELRAALQQLVNHRDGQELSLLHGLLPADGLWRSKVRKPIVLPFHPMVLYRGGWPDGS